MRLLIADDSADTRHSLQILLERAGYEVDVASNGRRALEQQRSRPSDVLITDIFMPDMDGLEAIRRFRHEFPRVKIIAMSGGAGIRVKSETYLETAGFVGADALLAKPFELKVLLQALQSVTSRPASPTSPARVP